jgi:tryptophanyl-tRNA synthetase
MSTVTNLQLNSREIVLTGDRVTGKLHLGHYAGSLKNRVELQQHHTTYVLLADVQALTTHFDRPELIRSNLCEVALDYLASGLDPERAVLFVQSMIPEIAELTVYFSMFVTVNTLRHNPTVKAESKGAGLDRLYYGFLGYPVSQAADIACCKATLIPVGDDQLPHLELTRAVMRRFNELYRPVFTEPQALLSETPRLIGLDAASKMSKSLGNAIELDCPPERVRELIRKAVTDPARIRRDDPGHPDICPIFAYHEAFRSAGEAAEIRESCEAGSIGCTGCKQLIGDRINELLAPMRERRAYYAARPQQVDDLLMAGTERVRGVAKETFAEVRDAMGINYFH